MELERMEALLAEERKQSHEQERRFLTQSARMREKVTLWQGKYAIVKAENNALRRKLVQQRDRPMTVDHPDHYQHPSGVECIEISRHLPASLSKAFEYVWRHRRKHGVEDLQKALWYLHDWAEHGSPLDLNPPDRAVIALGKLNGDPLYPVLWLIFSGCVDASIEEIHALIEHLLSNGSGG